MFRLWKQDPEQWLIRSKIAWSRRHESKRASSHASKGADGGFQATS